MGDRRQLDKERQGEQMTMFGKDDDPFKDATAEQVLYRLLRFVELDARDGIRAKMDALFPEKSEKRRFLPFCRLGYCKQGEFIVS